MECIAVLLAGGSGSRLGGELPKQLLALDDGRTILEHSIEAFEQNPHVSEICLVMHPDWTGTAKAMSAEKGWQKLRHIVAGGSERWQSSLNAIECYLERDDEFAIMLHDVARPFVSQRIIDDVAAAMEEHEAVAVGVPSTDTIWQVNPYTHTITRIPERAFMWRAQTPQAFRFGLLRDAYQRALQDPSFGATDDCGVVMRYMPEAKIHIVAGEEGNRKITFKEDLK